MIHLLQLYVHVSVRNDFSGTCVVIDIVGSEYQRVALNRHVSAKVPHSSVLILLIGDNDKLALTGGLSDGQNCNARYECQPFHSVNTSGLFYVTARWAPLGWPAIQRPAIMSMHYA